MSFTGTHSLQDLKDIKDKTTVVYGLEAVQAIVQADLANYNSVLLDQLNLFVATTTRREEADTTGNLLQGEMEYADEFSRVRTQKDGKPGKVGFPMHKRQYAIGFTADFLREAPVGEVATRILGAQRAHTAAHMKDIRAALFGATNYAFSDYLVDDTDVNVKALYNSDGSVPPLGPNGEVHNGTHSHYFVSATLTAAALDTIISAVAEHNANSEVVVYINQAQEATVRGLVGFVAAVDPRIVQPNTTAYASAPLARNRGNRLIGYYNQAEVWVKPWVPALYALALDTNAPGKVLAMREPEESGQRGLRQVARNVMFPLQADYWEAKWGYGVRGRGAAAALQITGNASYTAPA